MPVSFAELVGVARTNGGALHTRMLAYRAMLTFALGNSIYFDACSDIQEERSVAYHLIPIDPEAVAEAQGAIPPSELPTVVVEAFGALADPTRARILYAPGRRTFCVRDLAIGIGISESADVTSTSRAPRSTSGESPTRRDDDVLLGRRPTCGSTASRGRVSRRSCAAGAAGPCSLPSN